MYPLHDALPAPYVPVLVTQGSVIAHRYAHELLAAESHSTAILLLLCQYLSGTIFVFDGVGLAGFMIRANAFLLA